MIGLQQGEAGSRSHLGDSNGRHILRSPAVCEDQEGVAPGQAQEMPNEPAAIRRAKSMSRDPANAGALAFKRSGDPNMGNLVE